MTRSLPLLAILLFLLLLNLVHSLETQATRPRKKNSSAFTPLLVAREDYSSFNRTDSPVAQHKTKSQDSTPTKSVTSSNGQPSVTTIIIIQSNGQTYHELGGGPSATNGGGNGNGPSGSGGMNDPNESNIEAEVDHENEVVKRMISISTVVGGVGIVMIIAGAVIFIRLRAKRRRLKAINRYSTATSHLHDSGDDNDTNANTNTGTNTNHHHHHYHHRRHFSSTSNTTHISHHHHQPSSPVPTSPTSINGSSYPHEAIEMSTIHPSAPPEPTILPLHLRERTRQSLLSQQHVPPIVLTPHPPLISTSSSTPPAPSAPSAKELEMNLPSSSTSSSITTTTNPVIIPHPPHPIIEVSSPTSLSTSKQTSHPLDTTHTLSPPTSSSITATGQSTSSSSPPPQASSSTSRTGPCLHLKPTAGSDGSDHRPSDDQQQQQQQLRPPLTPDMPPPAYTPSAPPLFILPPSQRRRSADQLSLDRYRR